MTTYYLKTTDEDSLWTALESAGLAYKRYDPNDPLNVRPEDIPFDSPWTPNGAFKWIPKNVQLDIIGIIKKRTNETIKVVQDGQIEFEVPVFETLNGFHANLKISNFSLDDGLTQEQIELLPIIEAPSTPYRVWAGE